MVQCDVCYEFPTKRDKRLLFESVGASVLCFLIFSPASFRQGLVIKHNANQRYATTSLTAFFMRELARRCVCVARRLPLQ